MKNIVIGRREISRLIGAINTSSLSADNRDMYAKRTVLSLHLKLQKAVRDCSREFQLTPQEAAAIPDALELLFHLPFKTIVKELMGDDSTVAV